MHEFDVEVTVTISIEGPDTAAGRRTAAGDAVQHAFTVLQGEFREAATRSLAESGAKLVDLDVDVGRVDPVRQ